jgi:hypothetical protein
MSIKHTTPLLFPSSLPLHIRLHRLGSYWHTACGVLFCVSLSRAHACNPLAASAPKCSQMRPRDAMPALCVCMCVCARWVYVVHALAVPHPALPPPPTPRPRPCSRTGSHMTAGSTFRLCLLVWATPATRQSFPTCSTPWCVGVGRGWAGGRHFAVDVVVECVCVCGGGAAQPASLIHPLL